MAATDLPTTGEPWFDEETFAALRATVNEEVFEKLLGLFLENTRAKLEEITGIIDPIAEAEGLAMALHALKGSALMVGARELEATAERLRVATRRGDAVTMEEGVEELERALARVHERIRCELDG